MKVTVLLQIGLVADGEVRAIGMMEDKRADAGFRIHHHPFRKVDADLLGAEEHPDAGLVFEIGASGIAEAVALAAIARREAVGHGQFGRVGEAPIFADAAVQPFRTSFGRFDGESLQTVRVEIAAGSFRLFGTLADAGAGGDDEKRDMVTDFSGRRKNVVTQAKPTGRALSLKMKCVQWRSHARSEERDRIPAAFSFE